MRKTLIKTACITAGLTLLFNAALAQSATFVTSKTFDPVILENPVKPDPANKISPLSVNAKVLKTFNQSFAGVNDAQWYTMGKSYLAYFSWNDKPSHAILEKNGYLVYSLSYGSEKILPREMRRWIKSNYIDYNLTGVTEAHSEDATAWFVTIADEENTKLIRVSDNRRLDELTSYAQRPGVKKQRTGRVFIPRH